MGYGKIFSFAVIAALLSKTSLAADLFTPPPSAYLPPTESATSGWYLRGFIGASNEFLSNVSHPDFLTAQQLVFVDKGGFDSAPFGGGGIGYQWNSWLRTDAMVEFRGAAGFHALDRFFNPALLPAPGFTTSQFTASKAELVALANMYLDLGTWWCVTPFIGGGVGAVRIKIDHFRDVNVIAGTGNWADPGTKTNFAWSLQAGVAYKVNSNFAIELSYRYLNLGDAESGLLVNLDPTFVPATPLAPVAFHKIQSNDIMLGARWLMQ